LQPCCCINTPSDHAFAAQVFVEFKFGKTYTKSPHCLFNVIILFTENMLEWLIVYNRLDVVLLAECFESYREAIMKLCGLDPSHYFGVPSLSFDAFLYMSGEELELFDTQATYEWLEGNLRGGMSFVSRRHAVADKDHSLFYIDR
jgi:hypothetical protein